MKKYSSVIVTGSVAYDEIMDFPGYFKDYFQPDKLHQINVSFVLDKIEKQLGGTATNITYNIHLALGKINIPIILLGAVGKDGADFLTFFKKNKCDTSGIIMDKKLYTATGKVITDKNDNQIWGFYYGVSRLAAKHNLKKIVKKDSLVVISANHPQAFLRFQKQVISLKLDYLYDPGMSLTWIKNSDLKKGIDHCRFLVGNDYEISSIFKRLKTNAKLLTKKGVNVITTLGHLGVNFECIEETKYKKYSIPAYKIKKISDPTGAGDAWRGGFVAGLLKNYSIVDSLKLGNTLASFAIESYGTVNHQPTQAAIKKRLKF